MTAWKGIEREAGGSLVKEASLRAAVAHGIRVGQQWACGGCYRLHPNLPEDVEHGSVDPVVSGEA